MQKAKQIILYALTVCAVGLAVWLPILSVAVLPFLTVMLVRITKKFGLAIGLPIAVVCAVIPLLRGITLASVTYLAVCVFACGGTLIAIKTCKHYYTAFTFSAIAVVIAVLAVLGIFPAVISKTPSNTVFDYIAYSSDGSLDIVAKLLHPLYSDEPYLNSHVSREILARFVQKETHTTLLWYACGYAVFTGGITFLLAKSETEKTKLSYLTNEYPRINEMRLNRQYVFIVFLPALVFCLFALIPEMKPITLAAFNVLVGIPCAFAGWTLLLHCFDRAKGKAFYVLRVTFIILSLASCVFYDVGFTAFMFLGFADSVLNVRKMLDYALN